MTSHNSVRSVQLCMKFGIGPEKLLSPIRLHWQRKWLKYSFILWNIKQLRKRNASLEKNLISLQFLQCGQLSQWHWQPPRKLVRGKMSTQQQAYGVNHNQINYQVQASWLITSSLQSDYNNSWEKEKKTKVPFTSGNENQGNENLLMMFTQV